MRLFCLSIASLAGWKGSIVENKRGFTLVEVLLSISIITVLVGLSLPVYASFHNRNDLDLTAQTIAEALRRGQTYSRGSSGDSQWGVHVSSASAVLFKGTSYASRDVSYDETVIIPASMAPSGLTDVLFSRLSGYPNTTGSITLTSNTTDTRTISINAKGMVSY